MLSVFTVSFFGHRYIDNFKTVEDQVYSLVFQLIRDLEYVEFLVGRNGDFDQIASSCIVKIKKTYNESNNNHTWVMPYLSSDYLKNKDCYESYYDTIEVCDLSAQAHPKAAIQIRNRVIVDRSDLCVFFVKSKSGGAWQTMQYALKSNKHIINLAEK